ncbi:MAG: hypothetical protein N4A53_08210 [Pelagimonas sp.]|jgi:hypothetical protein|nr:hypothetical protein [Pelagimonas sp.]
MNNVGENISFEYRDDNALPVDPQTSAPLPPKDPHPDAGMFFAFEEYGSWEAYWEAQEREGRPMEILVTALIVAVAAAFPICCVALIGWVYQ